MSQSFTIPSSVSEIYPNPVQYVYGTPAVVFRDHRWVLPVLHRAGEAGELKLPTRVITFDRHRDSLAPLDKKKLLTRRDALRLTFEQLVIIVKYHLSPRDDDWIISGMDLGLISDVVQFGSQGDTRGSNESITEYIDEQDVMHRIFHLDRPVHELTYKGALADRSHEAVAAGLWDILQWVPEEMKIRCDNGGFILDFDLDYFTFSWDRYVVPFTDEIFEGEFGQSCQSPFYKEYLPLNFLRELSRKARIITIASEPHFCGGSEKSRTILKKSNHMLFEDQLHQDEIEVDYVPQYPTE